MKPELMNILNNYHILSRNSNNENVLNMSEMLTWMIKKKEYLSYTCIQFIKKE